MARIFLSIVSGEFRAYRDLLTKRLAAARQTPDPQEHFGHAPGTLLNHLAGRIRDADYVVHLIGAGTGYKLLPGELTDFLGQMGQGERDAFLGQPGLREHPAPHEQLSYTQFEYWYARHRNKPCLVFEADPNARREDEFARDPAQALEQQAHLQRIEGTYALRCQIKCESSLTTEVLCTLIADGTIPVAERTENPAIVLGLQTTTEGCLSSGAIRVRGETFVLAADVTLDPDQDEAVCNRLSDLIARANRHLARLPPTAMRTVVELVLSPEFLAWPLSDWTYREGSGNPRPIRGRYPVRLRLAGRDESHTSFREVQTRLALLRQHDDQVRAVFPKVPNDARSNGYHPLAVVPAGTSAVDWSPTAVVCGGFSRPQTAAHGSAAKGARKPRGADILAAVEEGVPYLLWPDKAAKPEQVGSRLAAPTRLSQLCLELQREPFAVFAESEHPAFQNASPLVPDIRREGGTA